MPSFRDDLAALIPTLRRTARALARDADLADDLVQDCLARALSREHLWRGGSLRAWLTTILVNLSRNRARAARLRGDEQAIDDLPIASDEVPGDPLARRRIVAALAALSTEQREVLVLVAVEGFTYREAAEILAIPIGTIMSRLARARAALATALGASDMPGLRIVR